MEAIFESFIDNLINDAVQEFHTTDLYLLLQEKEERMAEDCKCMLAQSQQEFAKDCFDILGEISGQQEYYLYHRGMRDSVTILKKLGALG